MRDRFVVITRRRRRRDGKSRKTSGLASLSPRERAAMSETEKQGNRRRRRMTIRDGSAGTSAGNEGVGGRRCRERDGQRREASGGGGVRRFRRASEAWPGKAVRHSGSDGGGSEPITYYNCLASERSERGASVRHPSSRRMAPLPITSAVIANFSRPCLLLASRCHRCRCR